VLNRPAHSIAELKPAAAASPEASTDPGIRPVTSADQSPIAVPECPACGYSLQGQMESSASPEPSAIDAQRRCPECGFIIEPDMILVRVTGVPPSSWVGHIATILIVVGAVILVRAQPFSLAPFNPLWIVIFLYLPIRLSIAFSRHRPVAVNFIVSLRGVQGMRPSGKVPVAKPEGTWKFGPFSNRRLHPWNGREFIDICPRQRRSFLGKPLAAVWMLHMRLGRGPFMRSTLVLREPWERARWLDEEVDELRRRGWINRAVPDDDPSSIR
jgi:hypothetical protein